MKPVIRPVAMMLSGMMFVGVAAIAQTPVIDKPADTTQTPAVDKANAAKQSRTVDKARTAKPMRTVEKARTATRTPMAQSPMVQTPMVDKAVVTTQLPGIEARASAVRATAATATAPATTPLTTVLAVAGTTSTSAIENATPGAKDQARLPGLGAPGPARTANTETAAPAPVSPATPRDTVVTRPDANANPLRFRLDDGRYLGFHQDGGDQPASGTGLPPENERALRQSAKEVRPAPR